MASTGSTTALPVLESLDCPKPKPLGGRTLSQNPKVKNSPFRCLCAGQEQRQELVYGLLRLLEPADLPAAKALVALALLCKEDSSLLGAVVQPQLCSRHVLP